MSFIEDLWTSILLLLSSSEIWSITALSIFISSTAVLISSIIGLPLGVYWGMRSDKSNVLLVSLLNTGMGLPPVLVGLLVYLIFTRQGPLGGWEVLFTPLAMIIAQTILTLPIIIGITRSTVRDLPEQFSEMLISLGATRTQQIMQIIDETRSGLLIAIVVALGRAFSEVGAILIVGGNIRYSTRVLTTAIISEIGMGQRSMALALGLILMSISFTLISLMTLIQVDSKRKSN